MKLMPKLRLWFFIWIRFTLISAFLATLLGFAFLIYALRMPSKEISSATLAEAENIASLLSGMLAADFDPYATLDVFIKAITEYSLKDDIMVQEKEGYEIYWSTIFWNFPDYGGAGYSPVVSSGKKPETEKRFREDANQLLLQSLENISPAQIVNREYFVIAVPVASNNQVYGSIGYGISIPAITGKFLTRFFSKLIPQVLIGFAILTLVPGAIITYMLGRRINILRQAAEGFLEGKFGQIKISPARDELGLLADVIRKIDSSLPALLEDRRQAGISDERNRVARNLHDTIKQDLFAVFLNAEALEKNLDPKDPKHRMASDIRRGISDALESARSLILTYSSDSFGRKQLETGIRTEFEKWKNTGSFSGYSITIEDNVIPDTIAESCYMIAKEAAANTARHSGATFISLNLFFTGETINLLIIDNGKGLSQEWKAGFGMLLMRQRALEAGGSFHITSPGGKGVMIEAVFPVDTTEKQGVGNE